MTHAAAGASATAADADAGALQSHHLIKHAVVIFPLVAPVVLDAT